MAQINVERKHSSAWIWWILGLIVLALIIWAVAETMDRDELAENTVAPIGVEEQVPVTPADEVPVLTAEAAGIPVADILESPSTWAGRSLTGEVHVAEVVSDRGFWIKDSRNQNADERLFVLLNEVPGDIKEINAGQTIQMNDALVYQAENLDQIPGQVDEQARRIVQGEQIVLAVDSLNVEILEPSMRAS